MAGNDLSSLYGVPPPPDPNAPTIAWGSPQATQLAAANRYSNPLAPLDQLGDRVAADNAARAQAVHFSGGAGGPGGAPGAGGAADSTPLNFASSAPQYQTIKAHDVQLGSDAGVEAKKNAQAEAKSAIDDVARAKYEENEANAQAMAGYQGQVRGEQMKQESADTDTRAKINDAYNDWKKAKDIDPEHYMSSMSKGKRVMLSLAAALTQGGMALRGQGGPNPILEQIQQETQRDIEAQKSKRDKQFSLYTHARENGLSEQQAHALAYQHNAELAKAGLDAAVLGNASPVRLAEAEQHKAAIDDAAADYVNKAFGRAQAQTVAVGGRGWTDKMAEEALKKQAADHDKGGNMTIQQAQKEVADAYNVRYSGGPEGNYDRIQSGKGAAGNMRSAGVQMEHKRLLGRYDSALDQIDKAIGHLKEGYEYGGDEKWGGVKQNIASEVGFLMHGGAAEGAVKGQLEHLGDLNQSAPGQSLRGHSTVKALEEIRRQLAIKRSQEEAAGKSVAEGTGFGGTAKEEDALADAGAKEL